MRHRAYKPLRPKGQSLRQVLFHGKSFMVLANEDVGWRIISQGDYEWDEMRSFLSLIREDDVCVDAGANIGLYSVFMADKVRASRTISFEPVPINQKILALNAALNGLTNVEIRDALLSDAAGTVESSLTEDSTVPAACHQPKKGGADPARPGRHAGRPFRGARPKGGHREG